MKNMFISLVSLVTMYILDSNLENIYSIITLYLYNYTDNR